MMHTGPALKLTTPAKLVALASASLFLSACNSFRITSPFIPTGAKVSQEKLPPLPSKHHYRVASFVFISDFELQFDQPLFQELGFLGEQIRKELQLPLCDQPILIYLFEDRDRYERYTQTRYPEVPRRRAFFVAQPRPGGGEDLLAFTYWGDRIRVDLRHELTHAVLHGVLKDVPLWLDEGLAEYFEVEPGSEGVNPQHLEFFRQIGPRNFEPDLARLEQINQLQQMTPREYRESWAWVHLMLRSEPENKKVLTDYLQQLRTNPNPGPLQPRLAAALPNAPASLRRHLASVDRQQSAARPLSQHN
jgi:hypothetical protein